MQNIAEVFKAGAEAMQHAREQMEKIRGKQLPQKSSEMLALEEQAQDLFKKIQPASDKAVKPINELSDSMQRLVNQTNHLVDAIQREITARGLPAFGAPAYDAVARAQAGLPEYGQAASSRTPTQPQLSQQQLEDQVT